MDWSYQQLISEVQDTNELLEQTNEKLDSVNNNLQSNEQMILVVGVILIAYILHHIIDAVWKRG